MRPDADRRAASHARARAQLDTLQRSPDKIGTTQRNLAWPFRKDDAHKSRRAHCFTCARVRAQPLPSAPGISYIVMELCSMSLLQAFGTMPRLTESTMKLVLRDMLKGLVVCHRACIVHRDVKADNFLAVADDSRHCSHAQPFSRQTRDERH